MSFGTIWPTTTTPLPYNATAVDVQSPWMRWATSTPGDLSVTGGPLNAAPIEIEFTGSLAGASVPKLLVTDGTNGRLAGQGEPIG